MKILFISFLLLNFINITNQYELDYYKLFIAKHGYKLEEHKINTQDGFTLSLWHLSAKTKRTKVVYFQHGLADTAWCFFQLEKKSLPFLLYDQGYDIWLGNSRGNVFSNQHKTPNFQFSMDQLVQYDLPATIKFIKAKTGGKKISYIGHSQGTTIFFMLYMHNPSFVESSFNHFIALGTVPNIANAAFSPIKLLDSIYGLFKFVSIVDGSFNLNFQDRLKIAGFCKLMPPICKGIFEAGADIKPTNRNNYSNIWQLLLYYPGGTSKTNLLHWSQIHQQKKLVYYNPNFEKEKTAKPYNTNVLKKWKIKALIARTDSDTFSSHKDVTILYHTVENKSYMKLLNLKNYGHLDVLAANSAYNDIFIPIISFLKK